jgi:hypothetical protein
MLKFKVQMLDASWDSFNYKQAYVYREKDTD